MIVWVCGKVTGDANQPLCPWELVGVFSTEDKARSACRVREHFIGPIEMDLSAPECSVRWPESYYPTQRDGSAP